MCGSAGTFLFATDEVVDREVTTMWTSLSEELKADYGEDFCRKVKGFMKNFRRKGVSIDVLRNFTFIL